MNDDAYRIDLANYDMLEDREEREARKAEAYVCVQSWAGRLEYPCRIVGETPRRYRVVMLAPANLPRRRVEVGEKVLVPKNAVKRHAGY